MNIRDIHALFDPAEFSSTGLSLIEELTSYLQMGLEGQRHVLNLQPPLEAQTFWRAPLPRQGYLSCSGLLEAIRKDILDQSLRIHHPRNLGHQVAPPLPIAALCDLVASLSNQAMAVYEAGPSATLLEKQVVRWMAELLGWEEADGVLTSGGAQANLTALLAARQCMAGWDVWKDGVDGHAKLRILASEHAHYSVSRAAGIMGLGADAVMAVATDDDGRMCLSSLRTAWEHCVAKGDQPFVVVATAGCTPTGSIDPLPEIGAFCQENELWFHVDGAHGASALLSVDYRHSLQGIGLADSVVWDGHKLLYMPATVSAVLFRKAENSYAAFAQEASYLFQGTSAEDEAFNISYRTLECTKRMMGLKLWAAFSLYGTDKLGELVTHVFQTAQLLAKKVAEAEDFELLMSPQTNIVCFRYLPKVALSEEELSRFQSELRRKLVESGAFHLTQTRIHGAIWLRATVMNPLTSESDLDALFVNLQQIAVLSI